jgi:WD40 repeat protein
MHAHSRSTRPLQTSGGRKQSTRRSTRHAHTRHSFPPVLPCAGLIPSPLFSQSALPGEPQSAAAPCSSSSSSAALSSRRLDPLVSCSAVLGLNASRCGVLWLKQAGLLAYTASSTLILFDLATKQQSLLSHHRRPIGALAVSQDGSLLATGSAAAEPAGGCADVALWDVGRRCLVSLLQQHAVCVEALAFSPDGAWLASAGAERVVVWDITAGKAAAVGAVTQVRGAKHGFTKTTYRYVVAWYQVQCLEMTARGLDSDSTNTNTPCRSTSMMLSMAWSYCTEDLLHLAAKLCSTTQECLRFFGCSLVDTVTYPCPPWSLTAGCCYCAIVSFTGCIRHSLVAAHTPAHLCELWG